LPFDTGIIGIAEATKSNIDDYLRDYHVIACRIRNSRLKAKQLAILEMFFAQYDNGVLAIKNGPLGDIKGLVSFFCPRENLASFRERLFGIGYCHKFYLLDFVNGGRGRASGLNSINPQVWKGREFSVGNFYEQESKVYEERSPHKRGFRITGHDGSVKTVFGYRGDGSELGRRSLPVEDARCMVNLSLPRKNKRLLDPFAGAGGIVFEFGYIAADGTMTSVDIDPVLKPGLEFYGSTHYVMNAVDVPFQANSFDSVVSEVPFSENATGDIVRAFAKINQCLSGDGVFVVMCGKNQSVEIYGAMSGLGNHLLFSQEVDRKGMDVEISVWWKDKDMLPGMEGFLAALREIH